MTSREMALKRWRGVSKDDRKRHGRKMARARHRSLTAKQRKAIARNAINARWAMVRIAELSEKRRETELIL